MKKIIVFGLITTFSFNVNAFESSQLIGTWCFYEQEGLGNTVEEAVTITLNKEGTYKWSDKFWKQDGTWSVSDNKLVMSNVGSHKLISVTSDKIEMTRGSTMRMKKGSC